MREDNPGVPVIALEGGNLLADPGVSGDLRSQLLLEMASGGLYDAVNVGPREAARWKDLPGLLRNAKLPWLSANAELPEGVRAM